MKQTRIILVIIILVAAAGFAIWALRQAPLPQPQNTPANQNSINPANTSANLNVPANLESLNSETNPSNQINSLEISPKQTGNGKSVIVDNFSVSKNGFVVIFDYPIKDSGRAVATSKLIKSGSGQDLIISGNYKVGQKLVARIYLDNGNGSYDSNDTPATDSSNKIIEQVFSF